MISIPIYIILPNQLVLPEILSCDVGLLLRIEIRIGTELTQGLLLLAHCQPLVASNN